MTVSTNLKGCKASVSFAATATGVPAPSITYKIGNTVIIFPYVFSKGTTTVTAIASNGAGPDATCTFTVTVVCGGGPVTTTSLESKKEEPIEKFTLTARPNPSTHYFTLNIKSSNPHPVTIRITDILGRVVSLRSNVPSNSTLYFGYEYLPGIYFAQAMQGNKVVTLKLVKHR
jgi:hypothetical protein